MIIWELDFKVHTSFALFSLSNFIPSSPSPSPSPSTYLLQPSSSYPWLPMVVNLFLTHLLLEVVSPITFPPSPFFCHWSSRSKGLHRWIRSKAYKLYMELHSVALEHLHLGDVLLLPLAFVRSIHFNSLFFILFSMYLFHCLVVLVLFRVD